MIEGMEMVLEMARLRGWEVHRYPTQVKSGYTGVTFTGGIEREAFYRVQRPFGQGGLRGIWEIEDTPAGAAKLLGILVQEGV